MSEGAGTGAGPAGPDRTVPEGAVGLEALRREAVTTAVAAGDLARDGRPVDLGVSSTKSSPTDVVTAMDLAVEALVRERLSALFPEDGFLGEEGGFEPGTSGRTWVVDPIDGTVNYLYGLPAHAVSVAVVRSGGGDPLARPEPATWTALAGCVHAPATGETWSAARGAGARREAPGSPGRALAVRDPAPDLSRALVGTGFAYRAQVRAAQGRVLAALLPRVRDVRRIGSAAIDLCMVADGRLDAVYEQGMHPWDLAAGALVVAEAGGVVTFLAPGPADGSAGAGAAAGASPENGPTLVAGPPDLAARLAGALGLPVAPG